MEIKMSEAAMINDDDNSNAIAKSKDVVPMVDQVVVLSAEEPEVVPEAGPKVMQSIMRPDVEPEVELEALPPGTSDNVGNELISTATPTDELGLVQTSPNLATVTLHILNSLETTNSMVHN